MRVVAWLTVIGTAAMVLAAGCTTLGFLEEDQQLYLGADVNVHTEERIRGTRRLESDLEDVVRPFPNTTRLGVMRPRLWIYHVFAQPEESGFRSWLFERFAEEPVLFEKVSPEANAGRLRAWLVNHGYFDAEVEYSVRERRKRAGLTFDVTVREPYRVGSMLWPRDDDGIAAAIRAAAPGTLVNSGDVYDLDTLRAERVRIDRVLKNDGFFAMNPDFLLFAAARDRETRTVDLELVIKPDTPARALRRQVIDAVTVYADHSPAGTAPVDDVESIELAPGYRYVTGERRLRPEIVTGAILFAPGDVYSRERHLATINRLMSLGVYRFVNIRHEYDAETDTLHALVFLTPAHEKLFEGEVRVVTRSNDFAGPGMQLRYRDRNAFGGAEEFTIDASSSFETRLGTEEISVASWESGSEIALSLPRVVAPVAGGYDGGGAVIPRTEVRAGFNTLTRVDTYRLDQVSASLGYVWSPRREIRHQLRPLDMTLVRPGEFSGSFQKLLDENPVLSRSFEEQFIIGGSYSLLYNDRGLPLRNYTVFHIRVDLAGNLLSALRSVFDGASPDADDPFLILNTPYSQFARFDGDLRYFVPVGERSKFAMRLLAGAGYPFGNSAALPRVKQFSVGGTNSIRAFQGRTIGPGVVPPQSEDGPAVERSGDLRLEANLEHRFPIVGFLKGAMFVDGGNVWTLGEDNDADSGLFNPLTFVQESAVGAGIGLRIDPSFFVLRFDVGAPLRKPWLDAGERWVFGDIDLTDREWRRENLVFNFAIGYPY